ncbi:MAG: Bax inhibitor-1/YccA family protein [Candidatus Adiutrix sp.]
MQDYTNYNQNKSHDSLAQAIASEAMFFQRIYMWMCGGLALTACMAMVLMSSQAWVNLLLASPNMTLITAAVVQIGLVFYLSRNIQNLAPGTAKLLFLAYAALTGTTFSVVGLVYPGHIIFKAFISTAGVYGAMAVYGLVTKRSLQGMGSFLFMGLIGLIIAMVVNIFVASNTMDLVICVIGVLIFAGLTAYDHQKLRVIYAQGLDGSSEQESRAVVMGALTLYLDFINLFLFLLRFLGHNRN